MADATDPVLLVIRDVLDGDRDRAAAALQELDTGALGRLQGLMGERSTLAVLLAAEQHRRRWPRARKERATT